MINYTEEKVEEDVEEVAETIIIPVEDVVATTIEIATTTITVTTIAMVGTALTVVEDIKDHHKVVLHNKDKVVIKVINSKPPMKLLLHY